MGMVPPELDAIVWEVPDIRTLFRVLDYLIQKSQRRAAATDHASKPSNRFNR